MKSLRRGSVATVGNFDVEINKSEVIFSTHGLPIIELNGNIVGDASGRKIERVIFNDPATIVMWNDGTKTVVKCQDGDTYDKQTGLLMCIAKKHFGNAGRFNDVLHEWVRCEEVEPSFDWDKFKNGVIAVHCPTEKAAKDFLRKARERGFDFLGNKSEKTYWDIYDEETVYVNDLWLMYGSVEYSKEKGRKIVEWMVN